MSPEPKLFPYQADGVSWLTKHPRSYLGDEAGVGKTRQLLTAAGDVETLVVAPAMVRDARVWESEAAAIGHDPDKLTVISYHQIAREQASGREHPVIVCDEAVRLKERKVGWMEPMTKLAKKADVLHLASGTPVPNFATELWAPLKLIDPAMPAYWPWVGKWFDIAHGQYTAYEVQGLKSCTPMCGVVNLESSCEHWAAFAAAELHDRMLRRLRADVQADLPPLLGNDTPYWTPMTLDQRRAYKAMAKDLLVDFPTEGVTIEALSFSGRFINLWAMSTGLSSADPELDDRHSGKLAAFAELLADRSRPTLSVCYLKHTAAALERVAKRLGLRYRSLGASTSRKARGDTVLAFQRGDLDLIIGSAMVVGEGLTLTAADEVILVERTWRPDINEQVVRRLHRIGQQNPVTVRQLVTPNSVDLDQWKMLSTKESHVRAVLTPAQIRASAA